MIQKKVLYLHSVCETDEFSEKKKKRLKALKSRYSLDFSSIYYNESQVNYTLAIPLILTRYDGKINKIIFQIGFKNQNKNCIFAVRPKAGLVKYRSFNSAGKFFTHNWLHQKIIQIIFGRMKEVLIFATPKRRVMIGGVVERGEFFREVQRKRRAAGSSPAVFTRSWKLFFRG